MDPRKLFADSRHAMCVFCGSEPKTREHVVSKILLDNPLPDDLPLVSSCHECNNGFSRDEEYLACLLDCVLSGSFDPELVGRRKVAGALRHSPGLAARIAAGRLDNGKGSPVWTPEDQRVRNVLVKLARGHAAHQYSEPRLDEPERFFAGPLMRMSPQQRSVFERIPESPGWPEVGSRAFVNLLVMSGSVYSLDHSWTILQRNRCRYAVAEPGELVVRIVLSEYLACEAVW